MQDALYLERLRARFNAGEQLEYVFFWGHHPSKHGITASCCSQWYSAAFVVDDQRYPTAEHFMMAEKAALFGDNEIRHQILQAATPETAKALGRQVRGFDEAIWIAQRFAIVKRANEAKFSQHPELLQFLKQTEERVLVEASPHDTVWGIGLSASDAQVQDPNRWRGLNLLGFALMDVRGNQ